MALTVFRKILVAFDGSPNSKEACEIATILAKGYKSKLTVVHVLPPIAILTVPLREEYETSIENKANIEALKMESQLKKQGIEAKTRILRSKDSIASSLIDFSKDEKVDLIVAGTRGLGGFRRMVLGSVSTNLLNRASSPVLVVRKRVYEIQTQLRKILVATDGSKSANEAVEYSVSIAKAVGADLTIVYVVYMQPVVYMGWVPTMDRIYEDLTKYGERIVSEASKVAKENGVNVTTKVIDDSHSPVWAITKFADEDKFDLIVVGTRGIGGLRKAILGSVLMGLCTTLTAQCLSRSRVHLGVKICVDRNL